MSDFNQKDLVQAFKKIEIKKGDSIFLTTSLGMLGTPKTLNKNYLLTSSKWILDILINITGKDGNIFVPTYSYTFGKKNKIFSPKSTKADIGYFPNFFLKQKKVVRSHDPMMSIAGYGPNSKDILKNIVNNSFGKNCVFERLLKIKNLKCVHIGLSYNWIPFLHYLDWTNKVPFRYDKIFYGYIKNNKIIKKIEWVFFARQIRKETFSNGYKIGKQAIKNKLYKKSNLGRSIVYSINYKKFFKFSKNLTKKNKWLTVNGPKFET
jgi:aminoglycoside 3-N-acetyltransferase